MPSESTPHSLTGFKLVTSTTFLPTISSGVYHLAMPETTERTSSPTRMVSCRSLEDFGTFSQAMTSPTFSSIFAKSSMEMRGAFSASAAGAAGFPAGAAGFPAGVAPFSRSYSACCFALISSAFLSTSSLSKRTKSASSLSATRVPLA